MSPRVVFRASSEKPSVVRRVKVTCAVSGLRQAGEAESASVNRLEPSPITHCARQTTLTDEELVIGG